MNMGMNALVVSGILVALCPRITLDHDGGVNLTRPEKRLVCGDPENDAWKEIPDNQAMYHLKTFLQARGYYHSVVERRDGKLIVHAGKPTRVTAFRVRGAPEDLGVTRFRRI